MLRKILSILLVLFWVFFIFNFSSANGSESGKLSSSFIINVTRIFTDIEPNSKKMQEIVDKYSFPVRKCAHFVLYFILGILVMLMLYNFNVLKFSLVYAVIICLIFATFDEIHQLFVAGRSGQISDVLFDTSASILASIIFHKFIYMRYLWQNK